MAEVEVPNPDELHERGGQTFSRRVALTTAIYAIVLSIAALGGNNAAKEMLLAEPSTVRGAEREKLAALAAKFAEEEKRYGAEKKDIEKDAKKLEHARDLFRERHPYFEFGEVLLQIAIVSASVSILSTSRPMFWFSLVLAVFGAVLTVNGYTHLFPLPFLHHH